MLEMKSLALNIDLLFYRLNGEVIDRHDYLLVKHHSDPSYYWGNLLIYPRGPQKNDYQKWIADFQSEFSSNEKIKHTTFYWDIGTDFDVQNFLDAGFELDETAVLTTEKLTIKYPNEKIVCKRIETDKDWNNAIPILATSHQDEDGVTFDFLSARINDYRKLTKLQLGYLYGAFLDNEMVSILGLYGENGLGSFESVSTIEKARRMGIAQTLMNFAANDGKFDKFIIQADEDGPAINMYKSIGFKKTEQIIGLCREPN